MALSPISHGRVMGELVDHDGFVVAMIVVNRIFEDTKRLQCDVDSVTGSIVGGYCRTI